MLAGIASDDIMYIYCRGKILMIKYKLEAKQIQNNIYYTYFMYLFLYMCIKYSRSIYYH